jgi:hypothetical protein
MADFRATALDVYTELLTCSMAVTSKGLTFEEPFEVKISRCHIILPRSYCSETEQRLIDQEKAIDDEKFRIRLRLFAYGEGPLFAEVQQHSVELGQRIEALLLQHEEHRVQLEQVEGLGIRMGMSGSN